MIDTMDVPPEWVEKLKAATFQLVEVMRGLESRALLVEINDEGITITKDGGELVFFEKRKIT